MSKLNFSITDPRSLRLVEETFPGGAPSSPNYPPTLQAMHEAGQAHLDLVRAERHAREDAVRHAARDDGGRVLDDTGAPIAE